MELKEKIEIIEMIFDTKKKIAMLRKKIAETELVIEIYQGVKEKIKVEESKLTKLVKNFGFCELEFDKNLLKTCETYLGEFEKLAKEEGITWEKRV